MVHHLWCHYLMESDITNTSSEIADQNPMVIDGIPSPMLAGALAQSNTLGQSQIMAGYHLLSTLQGEHINDLQVDLPIRSHGQVIGADASVCRNMPLCREAVRDDSVNSSRSISNNEFQEQFMGGASPPATSLPTLLETSSTMHENLNRVTIAASSAFPLDDLRTYVSNGCCDASKPYCFFGSSEPPGWVSSNKSNSSAVNPYGYCMPSNELSLSLATCQPSIISVPSIPDQCSEISCSAVTQHSLHGVGLGMGLCSEQTSSRSKELSLGSGSFESLCFSNILSGSKYLHVAQQILTEIASYSFENLHHISYSLGGIGTGAKMSFSSNCSTEKESSVMESDEFPSSAGKNRSEDQMKPTLQRQEVEAKKDQLLALLQVVNNRYNRCLDEIHTVISAFHAATELDPQIHARFVLQTISLLYNNLRERITKQILEIGECLSNGCMREGKSFQSSSIQKQWALQQLRGKDHQPWRPQRGLPERSVSVLRAWMYQNFLHPYPKDTEKHLLAIKSGLTRSQVSNWFINARVRLWKPMIEEMYSEMNNRKGRRTEDRTNSDCRSHIIIDDQIIQMN